MITVSHLAKSFGPQALFSGATFRVLPGECIGLVGPNGAGKTTLFSLLIGELEPDEGLIETDKSLEIGYLPQESAPTGDETVLQLATSISRELQSLHAQLRQFPDDDQPERHEALARYIELGGYSLEAKAHRILAGLAFRQEDINQPARFLSGGWIMRAHLARLLVMEPDLLMLDEPTNHLDLETLGWFQDQLCNYRGAILTISHDRAFLNRVCKGILEIANQRITRYQGNFDDYRQQKAARELQQRAAYENQQREIAQLQSFIDRFRAKATKAAQAQARIKQLEKIERIEAPIAEAASIQFNFPQPQRSGQKVFVLENVDQSYGEHIVYRDLNLTLEREDRIVLVGPNGAGKSTLLKILAGIVPIQAGSATPGLNVTIGYFSQQRTETLDPEATVLEEACAKRPFGMTEESVRSLLGTFLLTGDAVFKKVKVLSGGEKSRLALVKLLLTPPNLLLLDEPTTHLDMGSIDALIHALKGYRGTLLFVSHDLHFIRSLAANVIRVEQQNITRYAGDYEYYLRKSGQADAQSGLISSLSDNRPGAQAKVATQANAKRENSADRRRQQAAIREAEKAVKTIEAEIIKLEEEQAALNSRFAEASDGDTLRKMHFEAARIEQALEEKNQLWETALAHFEKLG
jgi:ATP-binding cassette subfamily F protein 3